MRVEGFKFNAVSTLKRFKYFNMVDPNVRWKVKKEDQMWQCYIKATNAQFVSSKMS